MQKPSELLPASLPAHLGFLTAWPCVCCRLKSASQEVEILPRLLLNCFYSGSALVLQEKYLRPLQNISADDKERMQRPETCSFMLHIHTHQQRGIQPPASDIQTQASCLRIKLSIYIKLITIIIRSTSNSKHLLVEFLLSWQRGSDPGRRWNDWFLQDMIRDLSKRL